MQGDSDEGLVLAKTHQLHAMLCRVHWSKSGSCMCVSSYNTSDQEVTSELACMHAYACDLIKIRGIL